MAFILNSSSNIVTEFIYNLGIVNNGIVDSSQGVGVTPFVWSPPKTGIYLMDICAGGGAGGAGGVHASAGSGGGGGASGGSMKNVELFLTKESELTLTIGKGGVTAGENGVSTSISIAGGIIDPFFYGFGASNYCIFIRGLGGGAGIGNVTQTGGAGGSAGMGIPPVGGANTGGAGGTAVAGYWSFLPNFTFLSMSGASGGGSGAATAGNGGGTSSTGTKHPYGIAGGVASGNYAGGGKGGFGLLGMSGAAGAGNASGASAAGPGFGYGFGGSGAGASNTSSTHAPGGDGYARFVLKK